MATATLKYRAKRRSHNYLGFEGANEPKNAFTLAATINPTPPFASVPIPATKATLIAVAGAKDAEPSQKSLACQEGIRVLCRVRLLVSDSQAHSPAHQKSGCNGTRISIRVVPSLSIARTKPSAEPIHDSTPPATRTAHPLYFANHVLTHSSWTRRGEVLPILLLLTSILVHQMDNIRFQSLGC